MADTGARLSVEALESANVPNSALCGFAEQILRVERHCT
jgi:hypothetical protein